MRTPPVAAACLVLATGVVDLARQVFTSRDGVRVRLSSRETALLRYLAERAPQAVDRDQILIEVWGHRRTSLSRAVDATVARLRPKLEGDAASPRVLVTVHGHGYRLVLGDEPLPLESPRSVRPPLRLGALTVDLGTGRLSGPVSEVQLTARERFVLERLVAEGGGWVSAQRIGRVLGVSDRPGTVNNVVYLLRKKLEPDPARPVYLESHRSLGYRLVARAEPLVPTNDARWQALRELTDYVGDLLDFGDCVVYAREGDRLRQVAAWGAKRAPDGGVRSPLVQAVGEGIVGACAAASEPIRVADTDRDPRYLPDLKPARSELAVPITVGRTVVGVLDCESPVPDRFTARDEIVFLSLATIAAAAFTTPSGGTP